MTELESLVEEALYKTIHTLEDGRSIVMDASSTKIPLPQVIVRRRQIGVDGGTAAVPITTHQRPVVIYAIHGEVGFAYY